MINIRRAEQIDHVNICRISSQSPYTSAYSNMIFSGDDCYDTGRITVAESNKVIVGFYCIRHRVKVKPTTVLYFIGVDEELRNKGIGSMLMKELHKQAKEEHLGTIELKVKKDNPAVSLYKRLGYKKVGTKNDYLIMAFK